MIAVTNALGPVFLLIVAGALLRKLDFPDHDFWKQAERLTYFILFPAMLIQRLGEAHLGNTPLLPIVTNLLWVLAAGSLLLVLFRQHLGKNAAAFTSIYQGGIRFNTYIGLACADALYGPQGLIIAAIAIAILIPVINLLCVTTFHLSLHRNSLSAGRLLRSLIGNPLIIGCLIGIALNLTGIGLPGWSAPTLALLGSAALPLGLLAVGVALEFSALHGQWREQLAAAVMRFIIMPTLLLLGFQLFPLPTTAAQVLLLFMVLPTASSAYILARQLGGDAPLMANITTLQTLLAFIVIPLWLGL